ncbi:kinase-like domain-containing protein [Chaetomium tenue]|uniref:Kinase-like domain-containing protein n=1 Tax=Chaetomium tenue TaxID=1854479 RepID=A0ACB7PHS3_9PEZI|nr:kinase-like domain-containing protein [Chaetomium globosum]
MAFLLPRTLRCHPLGRQWLFRRYRTPSLVLRHPLSSNVSSSRVSYQLIEDVERLHHYLAGGYHPVQIGDRFHERYRVVHKLGHGSFSTIWLARDEQLSRYVAAKVCIAYAIQQEVDILSQLREADPALLGAEARGRSWIPTLLDLFRIQGPNGTHTCFVTAPARCSISDIKQASTCALFQLNVARSLAAQTILAIAHIHEQGLVLGDLHLGNLLLQLPSSLDGLTEGELYDKYGAPEPEPVVREDGKPLGRGVPSQVVPAVWLGDCPERIALSEARLLLTDFGVAFRPATESRFQSYTPLEIRPPEARFEPENALSFASDIWSAGCTIWALLAPRPLLDMFLATDDDVVAQWVDVLGPLPAEWWEKWETRSKYFNDANQPVEGRWAWSLDQRFEEWVQKLRREEGMATVDDRERAAFLAMLRWMLAFRPEERPSAKEVLETEWMREWALPEYERTVR